MENYSLHPPFRGHSTVPHLTAIFASGNALQTVSLNAKGYSVSKIAFAKYQAYDFHVLANNWLIVLRVAHHDRRYLRPRLAAGYDYFTGPSELFFLVACFPAFHSKMPDGPLLTCWAAKLRTSACRCSDEAQTSKQRRIPIVSLLSRFFFFSFYCPLSYIYLLNYLLSFSHEQICFLTTFMHACWSFLVHHAVIWLVEFWPYLLGSWTEFKGKNPIKVM